MFAQASGGQIKRSRNVVSNKTKIVSHAPNANKTIINNKAQIIRNIINNMVYVEGGTFYMGATPEQEGDYFDNEKPVHSVSVSSFRIGKYEVTQEEWQAIMGDNPSMFDGAQRPVENVSWNDCQTFIKN